MNAVNALYATIVARGVTILSASGDSGAHGRSDSSCSSSVVRPDYPAGEALSLSIFAIVVWW